METLVRTEEDVVRFPNRLPTASGMGSFKRNDTVSKQSDSHKADFLSLGGTTTFEISSVIDPDSWNLLRACLDIVILGSCNIPKDSVGNFTLLLDLLKMSAASETKVIGEALDETKEMTTIPAQQHLHTSPGNPMMTKNNQMTARESDKPSTDCESGSIKMVKEEFDRLGMKMPKGIIFKEEKVMKDCSNLELNTTTEKEWILEESKKMPITQRASDFFSKKYKKKIKVPKIYSCDKCSFESKLHQRYYKHVLYKHTGRQIQCDKCDKKYFSMSHLKEHIEGTHDVVMQICETCNFKTNKKRHLERHILDIHTEGTILCTECPFKTSSNSRLKYHMNRKHLPKENWPKCSWPDCDYTWFHQRNVDDHYRKVHEGLRVTCEICPNTFTDKSNMQAHMMKIHSDRVIRKENARTSGSFEERYTVLRS